MLPFWIRRIDLHSAKRRYRGRARRRPGADGAPREGAARGGGDRLPQRNPRPGRGARGGEPVRRVRGRRHPRRVACAAVPGGVRRRERRCRGGIPAGSSVRSSSRDARASQPSEAIGVYSLGVAHWIARRSARAPTSSSARASSSSARSRARPSGSRRRSTSRTFRMSRPDHGPLIRLVFEDTLQPFVEISCDAAVSYALANQAGIARASRRPRAGAHAARRERRRGSTTRTTTSAGRPCSSGAHTSSSPKARLAAAYAHLETALELRRAAAAIAAASGSPCPGSA